MKRLEAGEHDVVLNHVQIHYTVQGKGPALIAIFGGPGMDARGFGDLSGIDQFVTAIIIHPRGSGLSGPAPTDGDYLLRDYVADIEALRAYLEIPRPMVLGWSHGGMVAMQYAFTYPGSLSKLILLDTSPYFGEFLNDMNAAAQQFIDKPWFAASYAALQKEWAGDYRTDDDIAGLWADEIKFYFKDFNERAEAYRQRTKDFPLRVAPLRCYNEREASSMDLRLQLREIRAPTLVIVGRHDFITTVPMSQEITKNIPGARLEIFENSGHYAFFEEPEKFRGIVKEFVDGAR